MISYSASVMENASLGTVVLSVVVQPADTPPPLCTSISPIAYSTIPSILAHFSVQSNGALVLRDFETQHFHVFQIVAQDGCSQTMAEVNITVLNVNDSVPLCLHHVVYLSISESAPPSNTSLGLRCTGPDDAASSAVVYTIAMGNEDRLFDISPDGYLSTLMQLDYESITQHLLFINVTKATYPSVVTKVTIVVNVLASNEYAPLFSPAMELVYNISESVSVGSIIANITAEDHDDGPDGIIAYALSTAQDCFTIDPVTGSVALLCALDREIKHVYNITILASDSPINISFQRFSNVTIKLNVLDINDNTPQFVQGVYTLSVLETVSNAVLLTLHCSDSDEGGNGNIIYNFVDGNSFDHFSVNPASGDLSVGSDLNYESQQFYRLKVQCSDSGDQPLSSTATVIVQVVNIDEYDPVLQLSHNGLYHVAEDTPVGSVIAAVSATDMDAGQAGEILYSINRTNALYCPEELFEIDPITGCLYLLSTLDKEAELPFIPPTDCSYQCPLIVSGHLPDSRQATDVLRLCVSNVNDVEPACDRRVIIVEIFEDFLVGDYICAFTCYDDDSTVLTYTIANPSTPFDVAHNSTHVIIQLSARLDYESQALYSFEVVVSDAGIPPLLSTTVVVHVHVKDVNEHAPVFITVNDTICLPEDTRVGTELYSFSANDNDRHGNLHYAVIEGNDLVVLNEVTGLLYLTASLDHEAIDQFNLIVQAVDGDPVNPLTATASLSVFISDINDNAPVFSSLVHYVSLAETSVTGTSFDIPVCTDQDGGVNSLLSCHISSAYSNPYSGSSLSVPVNSSVPFSFNFTTGEGIVTSMLDYEVATSFVFEIFCTDQGTPRLSSHSALVNIEVDPVNEFTPTFDASSYNVTVIEDTTIGTSILTVTASDFDYGSHGQLSYSLSFSDRHFAIHPDSGLVFMTELLDREQEMSYTLQVMASDVDASAQVNVYITVEDVNDNHPHCEQEIVIVRVSEYHTVGTPVTQLNCSDVDYLTSLHYTIVSCNEEGLFSVDNNGSIILCSLLSMPEYHLIVSVTDSLLSVTVNCYMYVDINNQPPVFDLIQPFNVSLLLSTPPGSLLLTVTASDEDDDVISYSIFPSNSFLDIDRWSGSLYLISSLQRDITCLC